MPREVRESCGWRSWLGPPLGSLHPPQRLAQQFRRRREIPVGVRDMRMPEIGRERGQVSLDIDTAAVPAEERGDRQAMAKIMQTGSARLAGAAQADLARKFAERPAHAPVRQAGASLGEERS